MDRLSSVREALAQAHQTVVERRMKLTMSEEAKRRKELQQQEKSKAGAEASNKDLLKFIKDQLSALKNGAEKAESASTKLKESDGALQKVRENYEAEAKSITRDRDLKQNLDQKKTELLTCQKKELDELRVENETFKNDLEEQLHKRNQELHEKTGRMQYESRENTTMAEKLDQIEKQILVQQQQYREEYESKKDAIGKQKNNIDEKLGQIENDIAKLPELTDQKGKLADEIKEIEETSRVVNERKDSVKKRLDSCEQTYKKLNKYMEGVKNMLKGLDKESEKLEGEIDKSKDGFIIQVKQNAAIREKIKQERDIQAKMKQMIGDLEAKAAKSN